MPAGAAGPDSFEEFFESNKVRVMRAVVVATGGSPESEDYCAEAFARAFERWSTLSNHPSQAAWVVRTAVNVHIDQTRRAHRQRKFASRLGSREAVDPVDPIDPALVRVLAALPERQREVLAFRIILDMTGPEVAEALDLNVGTVATHLHRALATVREALEDPVGRPADFVVERNGQ